MPAQSRLLPVTEEAAVVGPESWFPTSQGTSSECLGTEALALWRCLRQGETSRGSEAPEQVLELAVVTGREAG
jgi:hypothetical protein